MGHFGVALLPDGLLAQLQPGETALGYESASMMGAADRAGRSEKPRPVTGVDLNPFAGGITTDPDYLTVKLSGVGAAGAPGVGSQFMAALGSDGDALLLTDRRIMVTRVTTSEVVVQAPSSSIVYMRAAPRLLQFGRLEIGFTDGSVVRPMLAMLIPRATKRFLRAFHTGQPQS